PLEFPAGKGVDELGLTGRESYRISTVAGAPLAPRAELEVHATPDGGAPTSFRVRCRVDSPVEMDYLAQGGLLPYVLGKVADRPH
ncbi:MAG TPA: hypothetical protein VGP88_06210, partial [Thermoplasmata archaeon]|nr:hypothetical protein [Thermoplasmata archaeon]